MVEITTRDNDALRAFEARARAKESSEQVEAKAKIGWWPTSIKLSQATENCNLRLAEMLEETHGLLPQEEIPQG